MVVILHTLAYTYEKPSLVKLLTDCSEAMPRQQKYQNPQAVKEREKETEREVIQGRFQLRSNFSS